MLDVLLVPVFAAHLIVVNVAAGGPLVCLWLLWRHYRGDQAAGSIGRQLLRLAIQTLAVAVALGFLAAWLLWLLYPSTLAAAVRQIPESRYWFALVELAFSFGCLAACLAAWPITPSARLWTTPSGTASTEMPSTGAASTGTPATIKPAETPETPAAWETAPADRRGSGQRGRFGLALILLLLGGSNLIYHFPPLFAVLGMLATRPQAPSPSAPFTTLMLDAEAVLRAIHFLLASLAITGLAVSALGMRLKGTDPQGSRRAVAWGGRIALLPTLLQSLVGLYLLMALPERSRAWLLGADSFATAAFVGALGASLVLVERLLGLGRQVDAQRRLSSAGAWMVLVVVLMVAARHRARQAVVVEPKRAELPRIAAAVKLGNFSWEPTGPMLAAGGCRGRARCGAPPVWK